MVAALKQVIPSGQGNPAITAQEIFDHVKYLASDKLQGRRAGTEGADRAARYISQEFERYGLQAVGDNRSYFQSFDFVSGVQLGKKNALVLNVHGRQRRYAVQRDFLPLAFSSNGQAQGLVVFAGYGLSAPDLQYDDYANLDVAGKTVLLLRFTPEGNDPHSKYYKFAPLRYKTMKAREKGARAVLFVTGPENPEETELVRLKYDRAFGDVGIPVATVRRAVAEEILRAAGQSLAALQKQIDSTKTPHSLVIPNLQAMIETDLVQQRAKTSNVLGYLQGSDPALKNEAVVVGAHYDHLGLGGEGSLAPKEEGQVHNGADDNASGTAGLLELAEAFAAKRDSLKRSLLFVAFAGEEEGLLGSSYYVKHPVVPLEQTVAMINLDMIGRPKPDSTLIVYGAGSSPAWKELLEKYNLNHHFKLKLNQSGYGPSDHSSFYGKNIPVLFFFTGLHDDYHKPSDDYDKINAQGEAKIVDFVYSLVKEIVVEPPRPPFAKVSGETAPREGRADLRVYLGTIPDFGEEVEGVKLSGVREGSPAEKAGLRAGDIIIGLGDKTIRNLYDYTYALQEYRPGDVVELSVLREGERVRVLVTLGRRGE